MCKILSSKAFMETIVVNLLYIGSSIIEHIVGSIGHNVEQKLDHLDLGTVLGPTEHESLAHRYQRKINKHDMINNGGLTQNQGHNE